MRIHAALSCPSGFVRLRCALCLYWRLAVHSFPMIPIPTSLETQQMFTLDAIQSMQAR
jgi:hypothetical protein